ncbi:MAG: diaminopimelate epimerase [Candidatus Eremiobacteraeota bacterium]|nr:diaminopimelate epimerase [Candidatus Eremiobacteraeota bacterium]
MHGTLNDFLVVDGRANPIANLPDFAREQCDRRSGIGADGVLYIEGSSVADAMMRTINADGSEAEMCGNGMRCVARYLCEIDGLETRRIETAAGIIATDVLTKGVAYEIRVAMGVPAFEGRPLPFPESAFVSLGNPHVVVFEAHEGDVDIATAAAEVQKMPGFPEGSNVHVAARNGDSSLSVRHWERGVGITPSCGTGAVAAAVCAIRAGWATSPVRVRVRGGALVVEWDGSGLAFLSGPAVRVFDTAVEAHPAAR